MTVGQLVGLVIDLLFLPEGVFGGEGGVGGDDLRVEDLEVLVKCFQHGLVCVSIRAWRMDAYAPGGRGSRPGTEGEERV